MDVQLKRGLLDICVLAAIKNKDSYGYQIIKDMKPYLDKGVFKKLKNINFFNTVEIKFGTISWGENIDMCADSLYDTSEKYND